MLKKKKPNKLTIFDVLKNVSSSNDDRWTELEHVYNAFMINKFLSMNNDTLAFANEMNKTMMKPRDQYLFYLYAIPNKSYRNFKYVKKDKKEDEMLGEISDTYKVNKQVARHYYRVIHS